MYLILNSSAEKIVVGTDVPANTLAGMHVCPPIMIMFYDLVVIFQHILSSILIMLYMCVF